MASPKRWWTTGDDGFLVRDVNGNVKIHDIAEMLGIQATSDFAHLASLDDIGEGKVTALDYGLADFNSDGTINSSDNLADLRIWIDAKCDGITDVDELRSLDSLGIVSIGTDTTPTELSQASH